MKTFATYDLYLASAILAMGYELKRLNKKDKRSEFVFLSNNNLEKIIENYWKFLLPVDAKTLLETQKHLKDLIYNSQNIN